MEIESVIGLEVHAQINTRSKIFCSCPTDFGAEPNSQICPVCTAQPGILPVPNQEAIRGLVKTGLALGCAIRKKSIFARKQYFYPDLPKNYQISQYEEPLAEKGTLKIKIGTIEKIIGITRIHLEEDAGKLVHASDGSWVDLNRTGIPLMEIVSEPDLRHPAEAEAYLTALKEILEYLAVSNCDMEKGSLRCDANVSIRPVGERRLGTKVEIKNMNSISNVGAAITYEIERQVQCFNDREPILQETRLWDADKQETRPMRSKEEAHDYRYFPDPDLEPIFITQDWLDAVQKELPELPDQRRQRFISAYALSDYDAGVLCSSRNLADFFERAVSKLDEKIKTPQNIKLVSNWMTSDLLGRLNAENKEIQNSPISADHLAELVNLIANSVLSNKIAKTVFEKMWSGAGSPQVIVEKEGLVQVTDHSAIEEWVNQAFAQNPKAAEELAAGKEKAAGALVGFVMKVSKGKANPGLVNELIRKKCSKI